MRCSNCRIWGVARRSRILATRRGNHLEEFATFGLRVGEHAELFEDPWFQILGFVNQDHRVTAGRKLVQQILVQGIDVALPRCLVTGQPKIVVIACKSSSSLR